MESEFPSDPHRAEMHSEGESGEQGEQHQHKSVLTKVKDKAKKIKDTIKKHGHGHGHGHGHSHEHEQDNDDDEDDDEEIVNDPEVHGAPMYGSTIIRSINLPQETDIDVEKPSIVQEDEHEQDLMNEGMSRPVVRSRMVQTYGKLPSIVLRNMRNKNAPNVTRPRIKFGPCMGVEGVPLCRCNTTTEIPHTNDQSNVADPTGDGGKEENVDPLVSEFGNLNVDNVLDKKPEPEKSDHTGTGSHDQFAPPVSPTKNMISPESNPINTPETEKPDTSPKTQDSTIPSTIAGKISAATTAAAGTAMSAKNAVASKLGYGSSGAGGDTAAAGGPTMMDYLAEKLRPGDEDKALSEMITDAFTKKKEGKVEGQPGSKVRVSEELAARLGPARETKREGEDALAAGAESSGQGVVDRLRDAVGAWLGKSEGMQTAQESVAGTHVSDETTAGGAEGESQ